MVGCASGPQRKPGDEYLAGINVEGNRQVKDKILTTGLALKRQMKRKADRNRSPDPYLIEVDGDRIKGEYVRQGYLDVEVRSRVDHKGDAATVVYTVEEGVRARTKVDVKGVTEPALVAKIKEALPLKDGDWFSYEPYDLAKEQLKVAAEDGGYAHVKMTPQVIADRAANVAVVSLDYDLGPKCTFGQVEIEGVDGDLREAVENRLQFAPGQQYSSTAIAQTQRKLYALNRFSAVRVQPDKSEIPDATIATKISVSQSARHEVKLGGGFGVDPASYEVRGRAGYSVAGWPFSLHTVTVDLRPAYALLRDGGGYEPRIKAVARLEKQDFLWTYAKGQVEVGYDYLAYEAYTSYGPRAGLGFSTPLTSDKFQLNVGWRIQQASFSNPNELLDPALQQRIGIAELNAEGELVSTTERVAAFTQTLILDLRDSVLAPTKGVYGQVRVAEGTAAAGSQYEYIEVIPEVRGYIPLGGLVLAARARAGGIFGDLAPTERLYSGGASNQRGFSERKLAPSAVGDGKSIPYGGGGVMEAGLELRIPITEIKTMPLGAVTFLDGGDVTEKVADLDPANLHWAAGLGLRLLTIIGPVRVDFGYRLNRKGGMNPDPDSTWAFHFGIGEAF